MRDSGNIVIKSTLQGNKEETGKKKKRGEGDVKEINNWQEGVEFDSYAMTGRYYEKALLWMQKPGKADHNPVTGISQ